MDYLRSTTVLLHFFLQIVKGFELVDIKNVTSKTCIIGAGYSGIATAKHLKDYNVDFTVFEASKYLGGVWHFDPRVGMNEDGIQIFAKMYKNLRTNTVYQFSEFKDFPFPNEPGTSSYPSSDCIYKYLLSFAAKFKLLQHIQFRSLVTSVKRFENQWQLTYWRGDTKDTVSETCDFVVVANGFHNDPVWPDIPGADTFQGTISHSYTYRGDTEMYRNRRVLILGGGFTGLDLATHISKVASKLFHSFHRILNLPVHEESYVKKPDIKSITHNGVIFIDGSFEEVDDIIYCTGYLNWYPFLDDSSSLIINGNFIMPLYRKIVNIKHPSMYFVGASKITFHKILDAQGNYAASSIAGRFQLPSEKEMMKSWIDEVNDLQNIEDISRITGISEYIVPYIGMLSKEAGIPPLPPVFAAMSSFNANNLKNDFVHARDYEWRVIDDHNFDRVYVGPKNLTCSIV